MADKPSGEKQGKLGPPAEPSMERRLLLAFVLMGAILFLTPYFYRQFVPAPPPAKPAKTQAVKPAPAEAKPPEAPPAEAPAPAPAKPAPAPTAPAVSAEKEETTVIDTALYRIELSNRGAVVHTWLLKKYKDSAGKPLELVNPAAAEKAGYPFSLTFPGKKLPVDLNQTLYAVQVSQDGLKIDYEYSNGNVVSRKSFQFRRDSYLSEFTSEVALDGAGVPHFVAWSGGFGDFALKNAAGQQHSVYFDLASNRLFTKSAKDAKEGPVSDTGAYSFAGIEDTYFAAVFLPESEAPFTLRTTSTEIAKEAHAGAAVGGSPALRFSVFVGPKDMAILKRVNPKLEQIVNFGRWFGWLAKPLFLIVNWFNNHTIHNYGWAIVLVTIVINFALLPFKFKSMKSMKKMQALKPQIDAINAKYKNVGLRDPRKAEQNEEVMALYKKHGVNPMSGCLPMLPQLPIFIAFYNVLTVAIEMRGARWLWVTDLSQPEHLPIHILPILMIVAQYIMQKMTPTPGQDPTQAKMMQFMPLIFGFMFYNMSSGLVLYWLTSNLVGIAQQWMINRSMPEPAPEAPPPPAPKRKKGGK
jgi:YidC/Oxa1 family membrane protein insertase